MCVNPVAKNRTKSRMLAERKSKEKWSQDPRNTFWSRGEVTHIKYSRVYILFVIVHVPDKSKFGWRMLERMGWSEDDGLGREGLGRTDHIRVQKKRDNSGENTSSLN